MKTALEVQENFKNNHWKQEAICEYCGKKFITTKQRIENNKTQCCSIKCASELHKSESNCECVVCGKKIHRKPSYIKKTKNITCSYECCYKLRQETMKGENNHQYGLKGKLNASFKTGTIITSYGYRKIYKPDHPKCTCDGYIFEHRIEAEKYLLDNDNSIEINGKKYLSDDYIVHHIDFNRLNNDIYNLCVMDKLQHRIFHNNMNELIRDKDTGRIIGVTKKYETLSKEQLKEELLKFIRTNKCYYNMLIKE